MGLKIVRHMVSRMTASTSPCPSVWVQRCVVDARGDRAVVTATKVDSMQRSQPGTFASAPLETILIMTFEDVAKGHANRAKKWFKDAASHGHACSMRKTKFSDLKTLNDMLPTLIKYQADDM